MERRRSREISPFRRPAERRRERRRQRGPRKSGGRFSRKPRRTPTRVQTRRWPDRVAGHPLMGGELRGLRALVTGASKGIGYAVATRLRDEGATVLGTARTAPPGLPNDVHFVAADVTSVDGCAALADAVRARLGGMYIVVHVVGGSSAPAGGFAMLDDKEWQRALDLNLFPPGRLGRAPLSLVLPRSPG